MITAAVYCYPLAVGRSAASQQPGIGSLGAFEERHDRAPERGANELCFRSVRAAVTVFAAFSGVFGRSLVIFFPNGVLE